MSEEMKRSLFSMDFLKSMQIVENDDEDILEENVNTAEILKQQRYEKSRVPSKFFKESLDTYIPVENNSGLKECRDLIKRVEMGECNEVLLLHGRFGTGKTHLACGVLRELGGVYRSSFELIIEYEGCANFKSERNKLDMLRSYSEEKFLVIDEIGRGIKTDVEREVLSYIISQRYENNLPTILVTNMTKDELMELLGRAVFDRFVECCIAVEFNNNSKRKELRRL